MRKRPLGWTLALALLFASPACGDDDGGDNNTNDNTNQTQAVCGDGALDPGEQCDEGAANSDTDPDACRADCRSPYCGDGVQDSGEACDEGGANSDRIANACRRDCSEAGCGDGVLDMGETCDDGNAAGGDGCATDCVVEPHWRCDGLPSTCRCETYWRGSACDECVVYVDVATASATPNGHSWAGAFPQPQEGIDAAHVAGPGCEVWVAEGVYRAFQASQSGGIALRSGVALYGGFAGDETARDQRDPDAHRTVLTGESAFTGLRSYHVLTAANVTDAQLDGFVITGGNADGGGADLRGGGVLAFESELTVRQCVIVENYAEDGAGIYLAGGSLVLEDSVLGLNLVAPDPESHGGRGGGLVAEQATVVMERTTVTGNVGYVHNCHGVGVSVLDSDVTILDSVFDRQLTFDGKGAGLVADGDTDLYVARTVFSGNKSSDLGGAVWLSSQSAVFESCLFVSNEGRLGGAVYADPPGSMQFLNCTFAHNHATSRGGALFVKDESVTLKNSLVWGNTDDSGNEQIGLGSAAAAVADRCLVQGGWIGDNLDLSPGFVVPPATTAPQGQWEAVELDDDLAYTVLTDNDASWIPHALQGRIIAINASDPYWAVVFDNTPTEIILRGFAGIPSVSIGDDYRIFDLRLDSSSACVDAGRGDTDTPPLDLAGLPRQDLQQSASNGGLGTPDYVDIGAHERQP